MRVSFVNNETSPPIDTFGWEFRTVQFLSRCLIFKKFSPKVLGNFFK